MHNRQSAHLILQFGGGALLLVDVEVLPLLELLLAVGTCYRSRNGAAGLLSLGRSRRFRLPAFVLVLPVQGYRLLVPAIAISSCAVTELRSTADCIEPALETTIRELTVMEEAATGSVLPVDMLVEEAPRGVAPLALAALEPLAHVVLHVLEERLCR